MNISTETIVTIFAAACVGGVVSGIGFAGATSRALGNRSAKARHARLEAKVDLILEHLGIDKDPAPIVGPSSPATEVSNAIRILVQRGQKIQAIKVYRDQHPGVGLKEAKDVIDSL